LSGSAFCHSCGTPCATDSPADSRPRAARRDVGVNDPGFPRRKKMRRWRPGVPAEDDDVERELWSDTFSAKALINAWVAAIGATLALPLGGAWFQISAFGWQVLVGAIGCLWFGLLAYVFFQKLDVFYVLTNQRLLHQHGILTRYTYRIEVIDIDDVSYRQGLIERLVGVGTIEVVSSDETDPVFQLRGIDGVHRVAEQIDEARRAERIRRGLHLESV